MSEDSARSHIRDMVWGSVWGALALLLPMLFHPLGLGSHLMPMFAPLLLAALTLRPRTSLTLAVLIPPLSGFLTGMPPLLPPVAAMMSLEGLLMVSWLGFAFRRQRWNIYFCLAAAFILQRAARVLFILLAGAWMELPAGWLASAALVWGLPGAVLQTGLLPWAWREMGRKNLLSDDQAG